MNLYYRKTFNVLNSGGINMLCKKCGKKFDEGTKFCPHCGANVLENDKTEKIYYVSAKSRIVAILLTILGFFGIAGLQRIYVGRYIWGFAYIFTCGFFFIGTLYMILRSCIMRHLKMQMAILCIAIVR